MHTHTYIAAEGHAGRAGRAAAQDAQGRGDPCPTRCLVRSPVCWHSLDPHPSYLAADSDEAVAGVCRSARRSPTFTRSSTGLSLGTSQLGPLLATSQAAGPPPPPPILMPPPPPPPQLPRYHHLRRRTLSWSGRHERRRRLDFGRGVCKQCNSQERGKVHGRRGTQDGDFPSHIRRDANLTGFDGCSEMTLTEIYARASEIRGGEGGGGVEGGGGEGGRGVETGQEHRCGPRRKERKTGCRALGAQTCRVTDRRRLGGGTHAAP
jgi:hypothetical protein